LEKENVKMIIGTFNLTKKTYDFSNYRTVYLKPGEKWPPKDIDESSSSSEEEESTTEETDEEEKLPEIDEKENLKEEKIC